MSVANALNNGKLEGEEFKKITEAYNHLKSNHNQRTNSSYQAATQNKQKNDLKRNYSYHKTIRLKSKALREKIELSRKLFNSKKLLVNLMIY